MTKSKKIQNKSIMDSKKIASILLFIILFSITSVGAISLSLGTKSLSNPSSNGLPQAAYSSGSVSDNFDTDYMQCNVTIEMDGSITIRYLINFTNNDYYPIRVVDVGFPTKNYNLDTINASFIDASGNVFPLRNIPTSQPGYSKYNDDVQKSTYINIGAEIWLTNHDILTGESGQLFVEANNPKMIYQDYENKSMASMEFGTTWFDPSFSPTIEYWELNIFFPSTVNVSAEGITKWHSTEAPNVHWENNIMIWTWTKTNVPNRQYKYGVSFPADAINYSIPWTADPALIKQIVNTILVISTIGFILGMFYFIIRYFKVTKKKYYPPKKRTISGFEICCIVCYSSFFVLIFGFAFFEDQFFDIMAIILFFGFVIAGLSMFGYLIYRLIRRIRLPYAKPEILVDTVGVKKGLSVVEVAIIKNTPLNKVIFLLVFSLIQLGYVEIKDIEPLKLNVLNADKRKLRWFQKEFLGAIIKEGPRAGEVSEKKLRELIVDLIKRTHLRMRGNDLDATIKYYDNMVRKAWDKVGKLPQEIEFKEIEKEFLWLLSDDAFKQRSETYFRNRYYRSYPYWYNRYYYYPYYYRRYGYYNSYYGTGYYFGRPWNRYRPTVTNAQPPTSHLSIASFSDSLTRSMEHLSNNLVKNFTSFANGIVEKTRPIVHTSSSSGGRSYHGGGGCACACACAGCACACAGGGR